MEQSEHKFPLDNYAPHGYIDNPAHCRVLNMSGVIRSYPAIGMGWWYPTGRFDDDDNAGTEYISLLQLGFKVGDTTFTTTEDFTAAGVELESHYHTKNVMSFDFEAGNIKISARYILVHEHFLAVEVEAENTSESDIDISVFPTHIYKTVVRRWWGADGHAGYYVPDEDAVVQIGWAYCHCFALGASEKSASHDFAYSESEWTGKCSGGLANEKGGTVRRRNPLYGIMGYDLTVPAGSSKTITFGLARGVNRDWTLETLREGMRQVESAFGAGYAEDDRFYSLYPELTGDWPVYWKHGWIYDWETQRMISRPPVGIYKHHWDAMLIHEPRVVLGETAIDAMMLSYTDPELAMDEVYGTFADAPGPQVPCSREDGSMNMVAADGSECGTAPSWCFPFHVIHSIYCRYPDKAWLRKLYPYLEAYLKWWFENRTDADGWFHCKCSWESGQDGSKRFLVEDNPGAVSDYVRTVDVEASVAEALVNMAIYARILGKPEDEKRWQENADDRIKHLHEMYVDGWYRDFDSRSNKPIILEDYYDIMMLSPITCNVATPEQIEGIKPMFEYFQTHTRFWLEWPSFVWPFTDAAWSAGQNQLLADSLYVIAERVYKRLDAREATWWDRERMLHRIPGIAYEFWPNDERANAPGGGSENYGWGATLPTAIIRGIFGFHESVDPDKRAFAISPTIPAELLIPERNYGVTRLRYNGIEFDLQTRANDDKTLSTALEFRSDADVTLTAGGNGTEAVSASGKSGSIELSGPNGTRFDVEVG